MATTHPRSLPRSMPTDHRVIAACERLLDDIDGLTARVSEWIREAEPIYRTAVTWEQLIESVGPNLVGLLQSLMMEETASVAAPRRTGRMRASQGVPLPPVLHAYRLGVITIWNELVELCSVDEHTARALLGDAQKLWTALDVYSQELSAAYRDVETEHLLRDARLREAALAAIFSGVAPQGRTLTEMAEVLRLPANGQFVVIVCEPLEEENETERDDARTGGSSVEKTLAALGVRSAWRSEVDLEIGLAMLTPTYRLDRLAEHLASLSWGRIGVSRVYQVLTDTPTAVTQARLAREAAPSGGGGLTHFDDARIPGLLIGAAALADDLRRDVLGGLADLAPVEVERLLETFRAWIEADGSAENAGALLHCHPNTVRYRLTKLSSLVGRDLRRPLDVVHMYLAAEAHRLGVEGRTNT